MKKIRFSTTQIILLSFLSVILLGSILLALPISSASRKAVPYIDALFTATSATCVTGLTVLPTFSTWSIFGQAVILVLVQIGGLGVITFLSGVMLLLNKKLGISDRLLIQDAFNLNTLSGLVKFIKKVLFGTLIIECVGAVLYSFVFVPQFGPKGIWMAVFNSVSAFCNSGLEIVAENSLCNYATNPLINIVTCLLIILGGIGFIVWWDVIRVFKNSSAKSRRIFRHLTLHSKIVITVTASLILSGAILIFIFEYSNPLTLGGMSLFDKIQVSFFQSITTRTAGFATIPQENLTSASAAVSLLLMMVGGSPAGTAGGIKTITIAVLACSALATIRNKSSATLFGRRISAGSVKKAVAVTIAFFTIFTTSTVLLLATSSAPPLDVFFESVSATATVGLSRGLTPLLNAFGKFVIIVAMYFGRVGPISFAVAFGSRRENQNVISEPTEDISIG